MLTTSDFKKLTQIFATKEDLDNLMNKEDYHELQASVENIAINMKKLTDEGLVNSHRIKSVEDWVDKAAPKVGVPFGH